MKLRVGGGRAYYYPDVMLSCEPASPDAIFKEAPCLVAEVLSPTTAAIDTREKLQAYSALESLRYYILVESERAAVRYRVRGAGDEWLEAALDPGERIEIECGPVRASLGLAEVYEDTGLAVG